MITKLMRVTIYVRDYDEALQFYTGTLGLEKHDDVAFGSGVRWVTVAPAGQRDIGYSNTASLLFSGDV